MLAMTLQLQGIVDSETIGSIQLDASFSPIKRVSFTVEAARVEQKVNLDRLNIVIETNGSVDAEEAVKRAATILARSACHHLLSLSQLLKKSLNQHLMISLRCICLQLMSLELTVRSANCLKGRANLLHW